MKQILILIGLIVIVSILTYQVQSIEFVLIAIIGLSVVFLIPAGAISIFRRIHVKFIKVPFAIILICSAGILASLFKPYDDAILESGNVSEKLEYAYKTDQKDRMQLKSYVFSDIIDRDKLRLRQVKEIYKQENNLRALDKFYAAFIYHHSNNSSDYAIASRLATAAAEEPELQDHYQVQWLSKAAYDRYLLSIGKPEKYNTQNKFSIGFE